MIENKFLIYLLSKFKIIGYILYKKPIKNVIKKIELNTERNKN